MSAVIARGTATESTINAFTSQFVDQAMSAVGIAEQRYGGGRTGPAPRPLEGIAVAIKEETPVAGHPWTRASLIYADRIADHTAPLVQRVLDAVGIIHALTTRPEFSLTGLPTGVVCHRFGRERNR